MEMDYRGPAGAIPSGLIKVYLKDPWLRSVECFL